MRLLIKLSFLVSLLAVAVAFADEGGSLPGKDGLHGADGEGVLAVLCKSTSGPSIELQQEVETKGGVSTITSGMYLIKEIINKQEIHVISALKLSVVSKTTTSANTWIRTYKTSSGTTVTAMQTDFREAQLTVGGKVIKDCQVFNNDF